MEISVTVGKMIEIFPAILILIITFLILYARNSLQKNRVGVIVLGDIGRSPRMREHCLSLAQEGFQVQYIATQGSEIHEKLLNNKRINIKLISPFTCVLPRYLTIVIKPLVQTFTLFIQCMYGFWGCRAILMQNPPTIPVIGVVWLVCRIYGSNMIIDWHNYGYTILALGLHENHILVKIARTLEHIFGKLANDNFCVTSAMSRDLNDKWGIKAYSLHDRPTEIISCDSKSKHQLFLNLSKQYPVFRGDTQNDTVFTNSESDTKDKRPILIVSSTSWTADEDFSVLLGALEKYDAEWNKEFPEIICAITGKGPLRSYYENEVEKLGLKHVKIETLWLKPEQYPMLLSAADLGISLHYSSSGLDLPMKVVDMYAAGIPVCARKFKCISELVRHGKNGCVFDDSDQLHRQLVTLFKSFPNGSKNLSILREGVKHFQSLPWHYHWKSVALPVFNPDLELEDFGDEIGPNDIGMMNLSPRLLSKLKQNKL